MDWRAQTVLFLATILLMGLVLFEPPSWRDATSVPYWGRTIMRLVEVVCLAVCSTFLVARVVLLGRSAFLRKWHNLLLVAVLSVIVIPSPC